MYDNINTSDEDHQQRNEPDLNKISSNESMYSNDHKAKKDTIGNDMKVNTNETNAIENEDSNALRLWLRDEVGLEQYFNVLMANGFEDLDSMRRMDQTVMEYIGIDKIGHRLKLEEYISKLQEEDDDVVIKQMSTMQNEGKGEVGTDLI